MDTSAKNKQSTKSESSIQSSIINQLKAAGWLVIKLIQTNCNGIPDLLAFRAGRSVFIEVKSETGKVAPLQEYRHNELRKHGAEVIVARSTNDTTYLCQKNQ